MHLCVRIEAFVDPPVVEEEDACICIRKRSFRPVTGGTRDMYVSMEVFAVSPRRPFGYRGVRCFSHDGGREDMCMFMRSGFPPLEGVRRMCEFVYLEAFVDLSVGEGVDACVYGVEYCSRFPPRRVRYGSVGGDACGQSKQRVGNTSVQEHKRERTIEVDGRKAVVAKHCE